MLGGLRSGTAAVLPGAVAWRRSDGGMRGPEGRAGEGRGQSKEGLPAIARRVGRHGCARHAHGACLGNLCLACTAALHTTLPIDRMSQGYRDWMACTDEIVLPRALSLPSQQDAWDLTVTGDAGGGLWLRRVASIPLPLRCQAGPFSEGA